MRTHCSRSSLHLVVARLSVALALASAAACHKSADKGPAHPTRMLSVEEAQGVLQEERRKLGLAEPTSTPPTSVAEVTEILKRDQSERFAAARDYLSTLDGVDALSLRASLEMLWAEGQLTVAQLARDRAKREEADAAALEETLKLQPNDSTLQARIGAARQGADRERRLRDALETLAQPHWDAGVSVAREVVRRNPERADGYTALANLYRLKGDWVEFQRNLQRAEGVDSERAGVQYARALERAARLADRAGARQQLEALANEFPDLARVRAQLIVLEDDVEARYAQLQKLQAINPRHAIVELEGKAVEGEVETARALRAAAQPVPQAPAVSAP